MSYSFFGLQLHVYGLIIGLGMWLSLWIAEQLSKRENLPEESLWRAVGYGVAMGLIGARVYHVLTDWSLYAAHPLDALKIWQGGLSIIGGILGGVFGIWLALHLQEQKKKYLKSTEQHISFLQILDLAALSLPLGQAVGRIGNFVNQELFGWPTDLPWKLFIDEAHRPSGFEASAYFHPLFAYEMLGLIGLWLILLRSYQRGRKIGSGFLMLVYIAGYSWLRFGLEFLRIDKRAFAFGLGLNQTLLLGVALVGSLILLLRFTSMQHKLFQRKIAGKIALMLCISAAVFTFSACQGTSQAAPPLPFPQQIAKLKEAPDRQKQRIRIEDQHFTVEVVNTPESITQGLSGRKEIGSDGMLFVFEKSQIVQFWMKDMLFDLDLVWISDGKIVGISTNVSHPAPNTLEKELPVYVSPSEVDAVLEVPSGFSDVSRWKTGTPVQLSTE